MRNIEIADANILLRYLLKDIPEHFDEACEILENRSVWVPAVVIAEVVYVLEKVYKVPRNDIQNAIETLSAYKNLNLADDKIIKTTFEIYVKEKLDFVDATLAANYIINGAIVHTFDQKLKKVLDKHTPTGVK